MRHWTGGKLTAILAAQILCAAGVFCFSARAGTPGAAAASFLKFTPSPRATAMGESYVSVTEDAYAAYWNPAGLASVEQAELAATYNASFEDVTHQYISLAYPLSYGSTLDLNITRLTVAPFQGYDAVGFATSKIQSSDMAIGAAYGRTLMKDEIERPVLNAGVNLKSVSETLDKVSANSFALDLGAIYYLRPAKYWMQKVQAQEFRFAFTARNLGPGLKFDKISSPLPMSATLGSSWLSHPYGSATLILSLDQTIANDDKYSVSLGAEYVAFQLLSFRAGFRTGQAIGAGVRFGVGFKLSFVDLDYSMSPYGDLGAMHKLGMTIKFGAVAARAPLAGKSRRVEKAKLISTKDKIEKLQLFANDFIELAKKDLAKRRYVSADAEINKAFNLEPELKAGEWGGKEGRLASLIKELRLKDTPGLEAIFSADSEQSDVAHEAFMAYVDGYDLKAFLLAHAAWGANIRGEAVFEELLQVLCQLTRNNIRREEMLPKVALVKEKLRKAAKYFYIQQFDMAAKECEEAVLLDEANVIGWTRLGSAYYIMGDKEKAKKAYGRALALNPGDKVILQFMEAQGWK
ncbi:MAG: PorV/PorQ family protein [Elusimicrobiales bacterium]